MKLKRLLCSLWNAILKAFPAFIHHQLLKSYRRERDLTLDYGTVCLSQDWSSPVCVARELDISKLGAKRNLPGFSLDTDAIHELGKQLGTLSSEFPWRSSAGGAPEAPWGYMFPTLDSVSLYSMIRHFKPATYIEVGCGFSSRVSSAACQKNREEGANTRATYIEPYPSERLDQDGLVGDLIVQRIQDVPLELFANLNAGDMLFIDTSHILKCQSDVEWELLHILPILPKGVIVHIHDIYTPFEYPLDWLDNNYAPGHYNEQYAVEALLSGGGRFKPLFPLHWLCREQPAKIKEWFGADADLSRSFWLVVQ